MKTIYALTEEGRVISPDARNFLRESISNGNKYMITGGLKYNDPLTLANKVKGKDIIAIFFMQDGKQKIGVVNPTPEILDKLRCGAKTSWEILMYE